jgi:hypothetical protein
LGGSSHLLDTRLAMHLDRKEKTVPATRKFGVLDKIQLAHWLDVWVVRHRSDVVYGVLFSVSTHH